MNFFKKLYEGNYAPVHERTPDTAEFRKVWEQRSIVEDTFRKTLTEEQKKMFDDYQQANIDVENILHVQTFEQGFYIGAEFQKDFKGSDHLPVEE